MHKLIAQDIKPVEHEAEHPGRVTSLERLSKGAGRYLEAIFLIRTASG